MIAAAPAADRIDVAANEWRTGRTLLVACLTGFAVSGMHLYSLGAMMEPLQAEFGWTRAELGASLLVNSVLSVLFAPFAGALIDRFGVRRIGLPGIVVFCAAIALLATASPSIWHWWTLWLLISLGSLMIKPTLWAAAVTRHFTSNRGFALAIVLCGSGVASALWPVTTRVLADTAGWRTAYVVLGFGGLLIAWPLLWFFLRDAPGDRASVAGRARPSSALEGLDYRDAALTWRYGRIVLAAALVSTAVLGLNVHFVPAMTAAGITRATAASLAGLIGLCAIAGRLIAGLLLDRVSGPLVGGIACMLPATAAFLLTSFSGDIVMAALIAIILGLSLGAEMDVLAYLTSRYFGRRNYGALFGLVSAMIALGGGVGPTLAGWSFDATGSYFHYAAGAVPACLLSGVLIATLGAYPRFDDGPHALRSDDADRASPRASA